MEVNVKADNASAIACYERLAVERIVTYKDFACSLKPLIEALIVETKEE